MEICLVSLINHSWVLQDNCVYIYMFLGKCRSDLLLAMGLLGLFDICLFNKKQFRTKDMGPISTPTMLFYVKCPDTSELYIYIHTKSKNSMETK